MDIFPISNITLIFLCFISTLFVYKLMKRKDEPSLNLPPGPRKLPIIGSLLHLVNGGSLPHRILKDLSSKYGPLMHIQLGEVLTIVISSPQVAFEMMKMHDLAFSSRPDTLIADIVFYNFTSISGSPIGAYWRQMRKICSLELLSPKKVRSFRSIRESEVSKFIESIRSTSTSVNLSEEIFSLTYKIISRAGFGAIGCEYEESFKSLMHEIVSLATGFGVADLFPSLKFLQTLSGMKPKLLELHLKVDQILDDIILQHKKRLMVKDEMNIHPVSSDANDGDYEAHTEEEDLVDVLLKVAESEDLEVPITSKNIKAVMLDMFIGGADTSSTVLEWVMSELIRNPRVMKKAQDELRESLKGKKLVCESDIQNLVYLNLVIKETMRLHPPAPLLVPRECREQCKINGCDIPVKTRVIVNAWAIQKDPQYWDDGECFLPERFENSLIQNLGNNCEYLLFGGGRRMCPRINFGLANIKLPLAQLLYHFDWKLPDEMNDEDLDMTEKFGIVCSQKNALHLIPTPRDFA